MQRMSMLPRSKGRILVVENDDSMAFCFRGDIECLGYEVSAVTATAEEAILQIQTNRPDLILMDILLNGDMEGVKGDEGILSMGSIPIVYTASRNTIEHLARAPITDPFGYIIKPCLLREIEVVISAVLYKFYKEKELREMRKQLLQS